MHVKGHNKDKGQQNILIYLRKCMTANIKYNIRNNCKQNKTC